MNKSDKTSETLPFSANKHEPRLSKAAADYADALLAVQRERFERETACNADTQLSADTSLPSSLHMFADSDQFIGAGWTKVGQNRKGMSFRWMGRIGSLLLPVDLSAERQLTINGCGYTKRQFLKECTLWIEDTEINFSIARRGFNRWTLTATIPAMPKRPYYLMRLQSSGLARLAEGIDAYASLAVSEIRITS
ncbi:hypothetical protein [Kordiimonas aquimaris]|uniref:hypothetical protein n=1 Tax=Kordiimonas aquimaris TaxID=707591 RepID=UPI0021D20B9D|nr:hypothetical protein [Kordiimonas aquimaris]